MPGIEDTIKAALLADSAVSALIGERCYAGKIPPHDSPAPWVFFTVTNEEPAEDLIANGADRVEVDIELFAETYAAVRTLKRAVRAVLNRYRGGWIRRCMWESGDYANVEGGHNWTERYIVWASNTDLGAAVLSWGPVYLVWGS